MSRRIRSGVFTVLLVVWPIAVTIGQEWFPSDSGLNIPFAIASVIFYAICAFALRSRTIAGTLLGLSIWPFTTPAVGPDEWRTRLLGCGILGLVWGIAWEAIHSFKPPKCALPST
jgi:hypothetical protein